VHEDPTIFILDDDESFVAALGRLLRGEGFHTRSWTSAVKFLAEHDTKAPGCLLTDLIMPEMSGLDLQRALRTAGCIRPIVFITGEGSMTTTVIGMRAGGELSAEARAEH
jgi:FixJ family two-component response regulator